MRLCDAPVGLFLFEDTLCLMTEYSNEGCGREAYIVSTGETFWGGAKSKEERANLYVTPVTVSLDDFRPKGRWNPLGQRTYGGGRSYTHYCSECGQHGFEDYTFCPNCDADMRGGGEDA